MFIYLQMRGENRSRIWRSKHQLTRNLSGEKQPISTFVDQNTFTALKLANTEKWVFFKTNVPVKIEAVYFLKTQF